VEITIGSQTFHNIIVSAVSGRRIDLLKEINKFLGEPRKNNRGELADQFERKLMDVLENRLEGIAQDIQREQAGVADKPVYEDKNDPDLSLYSGNYADYWNFLAGNMPADEATGQGQPDIKGGIL